MNDYDMKEAERLALHRSVTGAIGGGLDAHARVEFTCGLCSTFAAALHELTGREIRAGHESG